MWLQRSVEGRKGRAVLNHGNDCSRRFHGKRFGLVGDQLAQERNETEGSET